jgi:hypothetical protein
MERPNTSHVEWTRLETVEFQHSIVLSLNIRMEQVDGPLKQRPVTISLVAESHQHMSECCAVFRENFEDHSRCQAAHFCLWCKYSLCRGDYPSWQTYDKTADQTGISNWSAESIIHENLHLCVHHMCANAAERGVQELQETRVRNTFATLYERQKSEVILMERREHI